MSIKSMESAVLDEILKDHIDDSDITTPVADPTAASTGSDDATTVDTSSTSKDTSTSAPAEKKIGKIKWKGDYKPVPVQYAVPVNSNMILKETSEFLRGIFFDFDGCACDWHDNVNSNNQQGTFSVTARFIYTQKNDDDTKFRAVQSKLGSVKESSASDALSIYNAMKFGKAAKNNEVFITENLKEVLKDYVPDCVGIVNPQNGAVTIKQIKNNKGQVNWDLITTVNVVSHPYNVNQKIYEVLVTLDGLKLYEEILKHGEDSIIKDWHKNDEGIWIRKTKYDGWTVQLIREWQGELRTDLYDNGDYQNINVIRMKAILQNNPAARNVNTVMNQGVIVTGIPMQRKFI